jgi:hypothetical protein
MTPVDFEEWHQRRIFLASPLTNCAAKFGIYHTAMEISNTLSKLTANLRMVSCNTVINDHKFTTKYLKDKWKDSKLSLAILFFLFLFSWRGRSFLFHTCKETKENNTNGPGEQQYLRCRPTCLSTRFFFG